VSGYFLKPLGGDYVCDAQFSPPILHAGEVLTDHLGWSVDDVRRAEDGLIIIGQCLYPSRATATVTGGTTGDIFMMTARVRTSFDRVLRRSYVLRVAG